MGGEPAIVENGKPGLSANCHLVREIMLTGDHGHGVGFLIEEPCYFVGDCVSFASVVNEWRIKNLDNSDTSKLYLAAIVNSAPNSNFRFHGIYFKRFNH